MTNNTVTLKAAFEYSETLYSVDRKGRLRMVGECGPATMSKCAPKSFVVGYPAVVVKTRHGNSSYYRVFPVNAKGAVRCARNGVAMFGE